VRIQFVNSLSQEGKKISLLHPDLEGECDLRFTSLWDSGVDLLFLCKGHGQSKRFFEENKVPASVKVIDLSHDFRLQRDASQFGRQFTYGLSELNREVIGRSDSVANPGCFATVLELALLPLVESVGDTIHAHCITGSTGAGQNLSISSLFSWRDNNISTYKVFEHQHLQEVQEVLVKVKSSFRSAIYMVPVRGNFPRGIFSTLYTRTHLSGEKIRQLYRDYYANHPFVHISGSDLHLKKVINTNKVFLSIKKHNDMVFIEGVIDNLMKGASGQAVQNMNIMFGFEETTGLKTKASAF
jgi:N-acetyl-gamma-glutamyl-phosphate reductase